MNNQSSSEKLFTEAKLYTPGGVNSPVRAFKNVGQDFPIFMKSAKGAYMFDEDWHKYIDYIGSWGPMILGHGDEDVVEAIKLQLDEGLSYGAPSTLEIQLAKKITELMPNLEQVRFVNSGTEATMSAIRVARAFTKRDKIIEFEGCYHGHANEFLVAAGSGALLIGQPNSPGVPENVVKDTLIASFNDIDTIKALFEKYKDEIACIIIEPIAGNMNLIMPKNDFLAKLRDLCDEHGALLIFDEVMTGFRVGLSGAQKIYDVKPDMTTLGKVIGGGMPVGAFGGRTEIMQMVAPVGPVYQAGTLSGNPIAMTAGLKTLDKISQIDFYKELSAKAIKLVDGLNEAAEAIGFAFHAKSIGGMFGLYFCKKTTQVDTFTDLSKTNLKLFNSFFAYMLENGVYLAPSAFEAGFISIAHSDEDIEKTIALAKSFFSDNT